MSELLDMCYAVSTHKVSFVLNPDGGWTAFPAHLKQLVDKPWTELKYFSKGVKHLIPRYKPYRTIVEEYMFF